MVSPLVAGYLASVLCRLQRKRNKRPGFGVALIAIVAGVLACWLSMFQADLLIPSRWTSAKVDLWMLLVITGVPSLVVSAISAGILLVRHRKIYDATHPAA